MSLQIHSGPDSAFNWHASENHGDLTELENCSQRMVPPRWCGLCQQNCCYDWGFHGEPATDRNTN